MLKTGKTSAFPAVRFFNILNTVIVNHKRKLVNGINAEILGILTYKRNMICLAIHTSCV